MSDNRTTPGYWQIGWERLWLWFTDRDERRIFNGGFRFPWNRYASVKMMKELGIDE